MFDHPFYLLLLWLLPLLALLFYGAFQRKRRLAARFLDAPMLRRLAPHLDGGRALYRALLVLVGLALVFVAMAGPMFGVYFENVNRKGADVYVLLDVSRSMLAEDVAPNRLQRAKSDIRDLLDNVVGDRVGLIVFAGRPAVKVPLTTDHGFFLDILDRIDTNSAPSGGTALGDAVRKALDTMPPESDRDQGIILITDGEDLESMPLEAAREAAERNVRILTVGLGDPNEGAPIPIRDARGELGFVTYRGEEVRSRVDEETLREMARLTSGAYVPADAGSFDLGQAYMKYLGSLKGGDSSSEERKKYRQQYQVFLAAGVLLLLLYMATPEYRNPATAYSLADSTK